MFLKALWALPCTVVGLAFAACVLAAGGTAGWFEGALEVTYRRSNAHCGRRARALPIRGIVFGHVILAVTGEELVAIGPHERAHVRQYERWGPFFFFAYGASGLWQIIRRRSPYWHNHFEVQARELASSTEPLRDVALREELRSTPNRMARRGG
jgi:hypothetical protein